MYEIAQQPDRTDFPIRGAAILADAGALGTWLLWAIATSVLEHPGDSLLWVLGLVFICLRIPSAWIDLRDRLRRDLRR